MRAPMRITNGMSSIFRVCRWSSYLRFGLSDYNFVRQGDVCVPAGPEPIPAGVCPPDQPDQTYRGSSGYRLIPGNTCDKSKGVRKDEPVEKSCSNGVSLSFSDGLRSNWDFLQLNQRRAKSYTRRYAAMIALPNICSLVNI